MILNLPVWLTKQAGVCNSGVLV